MTAQREEERGVILPKVPLGSLVAANRIINDTKQSKPRKKKCRVRDHELPDITCKDRLQNVQESQRKPEAPMRKDHCQTSKASKLPPLVNTVHGINSPWKETKLSTLEFKLPLIKDNHRLPQLNHHRDLPNVYKGRKATETKHIIKVPEVNDRRIEPHIPDGTQLPQINGSRRPPHQEKDLKRFTAFEETGSDASSTLSRHQSKTVDQSGLQRRRETANTSRDYLMSLRPPQKAKRYHFSQGIVSGAKQELIRMRKLMGRDNLSSERSHIEAVISESRRRAASINALMSGNKDNNENNSSPKLAGICEPTGGSDVETVGVVSNQTEPLPPRASRRKTLSSVLNSTACPKSVAVMAFLEAFRASVTRIHHSSKQRNGNAARACAQTTVPLSATGHVHKDDNCVGMSRRPRKYQDKKYDK